VCAESLRQFLAHRLNSIEIRVCLFVPMLLAADVAADVNCLPSFAKRAREDALMKRSPSEGNTILHSCAPAVLIPSKENGQPATAQTALEPHGNRKIPC
jgi:hypothetical protein